MLCGDEPAVVVDLVEGCCVEVISEERFLFMVRTLMRFAFFFRKNDGNERVFEGLFCCRREIVIL